MDYQSPGERARAVEQQAKAAADAKAVEAEHRAEEAVASIYELLSLLRADEYPNCVFIEKIERLSLHQAASWPRDRIYEFPGKVSIPAGASKRQARNLASRTPAPELWGVTEVVRGWACEHGLVDTMIISEDGMVTDKHPRHNAPPSGMPPFGRVRSYVFGSALAYDWTEFRPLSLDLFRKDSDFGKSFDSRIIRIHVLLSIKVALTCALNRERQTLRYYGEPYSSFWYEMNERFKNA